MLGFFASAFAVQKMPLVRYHGWLPDALTRLNRPFPAYYERPRGDLAENLTAYGLLRFSYHFLFRTRRRRDSPMAVATTYGWVCIGVSSTTTRGRGVALRAPRPISFYHFTCFLCRTRGAGTSIKRLKGFLLGQAVTSVWARRWAWHPRTMKMPVLFACQPTTHAHMPSAGVGAELCRCVRGFCVR